MFSYIFFIFLNLFLLNANAKWMLYFQKSKTRLQIAASYFFLSQRSAYAMDVQFKPILRKRQSKRAKLCISAYALFKFHIFKLALFYYF